MVVIVQVQTLVNLGVDTTAKTKSGQTAADVARESGHTLAALIVEGQRIYQAPVPVQVCVPTSIAH